MRSVVLLSLVGSAAIEALASAGVQVGTKSAVSAISRLPGKVRGVISSTKMAPVAGGVVGGSVKALSTRAVGEFAKVSFPRAGEAESLEVS